MKTIIIDLDGTLADIHHRLHYLRNKRKDWKSFFQGMGLDPLNEWCKVLMQAMKKEGFSIAIVSGRPDSYEEDIRAWLKKHEVPFDFLHLRKDGDFREDTLVKKEILDRHFSKAEILFVVDDRPSVVDMWRKEGLVCLQCEPSESGDSKTDSVV